MVDCIIQEWLPLDTYRSPYRSITSIVSSDGMHESYKRGRNDFAPECQSLGQFLWAIRQGYSSATMPSGSGLGGLKRLLALLPSDGIRLKSLRLVDETIDVPTARLLCEMVCLDVEGHGLSCLHLKDCMWKPGAMAALAPSMLHPGRSNCLEALLLQSTSGEQSVKAAPQDLFESLGYVLGDWRCSLYALSLVGMLGWNHRYGPVEGVDWTCMYRRNALVARGMLSNTSIRYLSTGDCIVDTEQLVAWADALAKHRWLRQLLVSFYPVSREALIAVGEPAAKIVRESVSIRHLMLFYDMCERWLSVPPPLDLLRAAIRQNRALLSISIGTDGGEYSGNEDELDVEHDKNLDAVVANPRIVFYDWCTINMTHFNDSVEVVMVPRLYQYQSRQSRLWALVQHRTAAQAHRDARLVWRAAAEGRPLELAKRLRLGVMAGGAEQEMLVSGRRLNAVQAAEAGEHSECALLVRRSVARELNRRAIRFANDDTSEEVSSCSCMLL